MSALDRRQLLALAAAAATKALDPSAAGAALNASAAEVTGYRPVSWHGRRLTDGAPVQVLRIFDRAGSPHLLTVEPESLQTAVVAAALVELAPAAAGDSRYDRLLRLAGAPPWPLENAGLRHATEPVDGVFLTVDLCPSSRPPARRLFEALLAGTRPRPVPVALGVSGAWARHWRSELDWLRAREAAGDLAITWVNHSDHHFFDPALPYRQNFLLHEGADQQREILGLETTLLGLGLVPSVFFRCPGLIADARLIARLTGLGLITLGADAWLAKGQPVRPGAILLVHGNGNEPHGVDLLLRLLRPSAGSAPGGGLTLMPLAALAG
jgi:hypothetical protein